MGLPCFDLDSPDPPGAPLGTVKEELPEQLARRVAIAMAMALSVIVVFMFLLGCFHNGG